MPKDVCRGSRSDIEVYCLLRGTQSERVPMKFMLSSVERPWLNVARSFQTIKIMIWTKYRLNIITWKITFRFRVRFIFVHMFVAAETRKKLFMHFWFFVCLLRSVVINILSLTKFIERLRFLTFPVSTSKIFAKQCDELILCLFYFAYAWELIISFNDLTLSGEIQKPPKMSSSAQLDKHE